MVGLSFILKGTQQFLGLAVATVEDEWELSGMQSFEPQHFQ